MPDNSPQKFPLPFRPGDLPLAVKDGMCEVRFRLREGARKVAESVDAMAHPADRSHEGQPLALLARPLNLALQTTARVLRYADHAAVSLLKPDGPLEDLSTPIPSSASYFVDDRGADEIRAFAEDHARRYRHWLRARGWSDVFVHAHGCDRAGRQLVASLAGSEDGSARQTHLRRAAQVAVVLHATSPITLDFMPDDDRYADPDEFAWHAALCIVLAGEIAATLDIATEHRTATALVLADEITTASRTAWKSHPRSGLHGAAIEQWLGTVLRRL